MAVSDAWLRSFVAAVDAGSFTAAAKKLGVGQPAISHAVARLERELGVVLFDRSGPRMALTPVGRLLCERAAVAFADLDNAVGAARPQSTAAMVTLSVSTSLASYWLLPRLSDFKRRYPGIDLRLLTTDSDDLIGLDDADLWIPLGPIERADLAVEVFRDESVIPVAAPALAETVDFNDPDALLTAPLIHLEERYTSRYDWWRWFADHGVARPSLLAGYRSNDYSLVLQAALDGQGVALGWQHIVEDLIADERLVALADPVVTGNPFQILHRRGNELRPDVVKLRSWLRAEGR